MNKHLSLLAVSLLSVSAFAQGRITLSNTDLPNPSGGGTYNAVIQIAPNLGEFTSYQNWTAGLFQEGSLVPLGSTPFFNGTGADAQFNWMFLNNPEVVVPNVMPGQTARLFVGVWHNSTTFEGAPVYLRGQSDVFTSRPLGGPNPVPGEPAFFTPVTTFQGFTLLVPEPTTTALALIGGAALLLRRRK